MSRVFTDLDEAKKAADVENAKPVADGKHRNPFKVYEFKATKADAQVYAIGQTPTAALSGAADSLGITCDRVDNDTLMPVNEYLSKLSSDELEQARKLLANLSA